MTGKRKRYAADLKAKVALEALKGELTLSQLAAKHGVHQTMIAAWRKQAIEGLSGVLSGKAEATEGRRSMIDPNDPKISIQRQCALVSISRSAFYYQPPGETPLNLALMRLIDEAFLETPWYGSRQMARHLRRQGYRVGRMRVRRLMARMGLSPIYQKPRTTIPHPEHRACKYLLRGLTIDKPNQVWCADITYIPMRRGFLYLGRQRSSTPTRAARLPRPASSTC